MKSSTPPPDPNVGLAQREMTEIARSAEARAAASDKYFNETLAPKYLEQIDFANKIAKDQYTKQSEAQDFSMGLAKKYDDRYWATTAKQQDAFYDSVDKYDTAAARDEMAGQAGADVEQATAINQQALQRGLARRGVNPGSGASAAATQQASTEGALARAGAMTLAQRAAKAEGLQLRAQAAGLGGNLTGATSSFLGGSAAAGGAASGAGTGGLSALGNYTNALGSNTAGYNATTGLATQNFNNVGNLGMQEWLEKSKVAQQNANGFNQIIGAGLGAAVRYSDRRLKTDVQRIGVRPDGLGVYSYRYVWGDARHVGVMADEVRQIYPDAVTTVNGYDKVDYTQLQYRG